MNRDFYRHVFNERRGQVMAVAESAVGDGKGTGTAGRHGAGAGTARWARLRRLGFCLLVAFGGAAVLPAAAQVVAYKAAPAAQQATILSAGNGVPLINIQTPSAAGVSHNTYGQFDVGAAGAILNNARNNVATQLGGWVQGNPWLARGTARVILNEVVSSTPSLLGGYIEVAGDRAQVVVANPAGVTCAGCGFLNAHRATLTTGTPLLSAGTLDGYRVEGGTLRIDGAGLDARGADYTDLIARAVELNAGVWAQALNVTTGANRVDAAHTQAVPISGTGPAPAFALDVAPLGGMYAGKIVLVGTEAGVGVRNAGTLAASAGEVLVTAEGQLLNRGTVVSGESSLTVATRGLDNTGTLASDGTLTVASRGDIDNSGLLHAGRELILATDGQLANRQGTLDGQRLELSAGTLVNDGGVRQSGTQALALTAAHLDNAAAGVIGHLAAPSEAGGGTPSGGAGTGSGSGVGTETGALAGVPTASTAGGTLAVDTAVPLPLADGRIAVGTLTNTGTLVASGTVALTTTGTLANAGTLTVDRLTATGTAFRNSGTVTATDAALAAATLDNRGGALSVSGRLAVAAYDLLNVRGTFDYAGADALTLTLAGRFDNTEGRFASNGRGLSLTADTVDNTGGVLTLAGDGALTLTSGQLINAAGTIQGQGAVTVHAGMVNNAAGALGAQGALVVTAAGLDNTGGRITSEQGGMLTVAGALDNRGGTLASGQALTVQSATLDNRTGGRIVANDALAVTTTTGRLDNAGGTLSAAKALTVTAQGDVANAAGQLVAGTDLTLRTDGALDNSGGTVGAVAGRLDLSAGGAVTNAGGRLEAATDLVLASQGLGNAGGTVLGKTLTVDTHGQALDNTQGVLAAETTLQIDSGALTNTGGLLQAGGALTLDTHGQTLINRDTLDDGTGILGQSTVTLTTGALDNAAGLVSTGDALALTAAGRFNNTGGTLASAAVLTLAAGDIENRAGGQIVADDALTLTTTAGGLDNAGGTLSAKQALIVSTAGALTNTTGTLVGGTDLTLHTDGALDNTDGTLGAVAGGLTLSAGGLLTNAGGRLEAAHAVVLASRGLANAGGTVFGQTLALDTRGQALDNAQGQLVADRTLHIDSGALDNTAGLIQAGDALTLDTHGQALTNRDTLGDGRGLRGQGTVTLTAGALDNAAGRISAGGALTLTAAALDNSGGQTVGSGAGTVAVTGALDNRGGMLATEGALAVAAGRLDNGSGGRIVANDALAVTTTTGLLANAGGTLSARQTLTVGAAGALDNNAGVMVGGTDLTLNAGGALDNRGGTLAAVGGRLDVTAAGRIDSTAGRLEAATDLVLDSQGLGNAGGTVFGQTLDIDTHGQALNNAQGQLVADRTLRIGSGALDNTGGLIQAGDALTLDTHGQTLTNAQSGEHGGLFGQSSVTLHTGDLNNTAGFLGAKGALAITAADLANIGGRLTSEDTLRIEAGTLDNSGGQLQALQDIGIRADGTVTNTAGLIRAAQALALSAATVDNAGTLGTGQGLEGGSVILTAGTLANAGGAVRANTALTVTSAGTLDNTGGLLSSADALTLHDPNATAKTLSITNTGGTIIADRQLAIDTAHFTGDGKLLSKEDLTLTLTGDLHVTGEITANRGARVETAGLLTNDGTLQAGQTLAVQANRLTNTASGKILANGMDIAAGALTNRGLIDGGETLITAGTLDNLGTGRLYGDHLAIAAGTLNNLAEGGTAPVIAARSRLDLGVGTLANRDGALLFSAEDMAIGGGLDAGRHATGQAGSLFNHAATIESLGNLSIAAGEIKNTNAGLVTETVFESSRHIEEVQPEGWGQRYDVAFFPTIFNYKIEKQSYVVDGVVVGRFEDYTFYDYTATTTVTEVVSTSPGKILAGGNFMLTGNLENIDSQIIVGGTLKQSGGVLVNTSTQGTRTTTYDGWAQFRDWDGNSEKLKFRTPYSFSPAPVVTTFSLGTARIEEHAATNASTTLDDRAIGRVNADAAGAGQASAAAGPAGDAARTASAGTASISVGAEQNIAATAQTTSANTTATGGAGTARITQVTAAGSASGPSAIIATADLPLALPANRLYHTNPNSTAGYLVETDPQFANYRSWLSSDYLLKALGLDPAMTQKRLGDGFYEQRLITEQIAQLTGHRFLTGYASDEEQYRALMAAGLTVARDWQLIPGVALTAAQMAQLTTDIVWLVEKTVTLADGSTQRVLVPQVYARTRPGDVTPSGSLIAASSMELTLTGDLTNSGTIAGRELVSLSAENIRNTGAIAGRDVAVRANTDLTVAGGSISAERTLIATAGRDLTVASTTRDTENVEGAARFTRTHIDRLAGLYVTGANGTLVASAGHDLTLLAAAVVNGASSSSTGAGAGQTVLAAGHDLTLGTVRIAESNHTGLNAANVNRSGGTAEVGTSVVGTGDVTLAAAGDLRARAASVTSTAGALSVTAGNDLVIEAGEASSYSEITQKTKRSGTFSSTTKIQRDAFEETTAISSTFSGDTVALAAGNDLTVKGSSIVAQGDLTAVAGHDLTITAATERRAETHYHKETESGLFGSGGIGVTIGSRMLSTDQRSTATTAVGSTLGSVEGNVTLVAGNAYTQIGSEVLAPGGDIGVLAKSIAIEEARETSHTSYEMKAKQSGLTVAITSPVISAVQTIGQMAQAAGDTSDGRMHALAAASAGLAGYQGYKAIETGQGKTVTLDDGTVKTNQMDVFNDKGEVIGTRDATTGERAGGINLSLSLGTSKSHSMSTATSDTAAGSTLAAGGNVTLIATGGGAESDIRIQGAKVLAGQDVTLLADDAIELLAARNTASQTSKNSSSSASVGISFGTDGLLFNIGASQGKGKANGSDLAWTNTHVQAGETLTLVSGGDTTLKGAVAGGKQVIAEVGGNLLLESLQDLSTYDSKQSSAGFTLSIGYGKVSGSVSASGSKVESDYASVTEQTGLLAGDGGFNVTVRGNTDLKGAVIASTDKAAENGKNQLTTASLTTSDIQNWAKTDASSSGFTVSTDMFTQGKYGMAKGIVSNALNDAEASDSSHEQTRAAVSAATVTITDEVAQQQRTGQTAEQAIAELNRDVATAHNAAERINYQKLEKTAEAERTIKQEAVKAATLFTDEAYRTSFLEKARMYKVLRNSESGEVIRGADGKPVMVELTDAEKWALRPEPGGKLNIFTNGIFNDTAAAAGYAVQMSELPPGQDIYLMYYPQASNAVSELLVAGYQKFLEGNVGDLANATQEIKRLMATYGEDGLNLVAHSRGAMTVGNAMASLANDPGSASILTNTSIKFVGPAYNAHTAADLLNWLSSGNVTSVRLQNHADDFVGSFIGGNPATNAQRPDENNRLTEWFRIFGDAPTVHSCYGTGAAHENCYPNYGVPVSIDIQSNHQR